MNFFNNFFPFIDSGHWKIQPFNFPSGVAVGQRVSTSCSTSGGRRLSFEWLKDGKNVKDISHIKVVVVSDISNIIIEPATESDSGNYTCVASSEGKTDMYVATLNVYGKKINNYYYFLLNFLIFKYFIKMYNDNLNSVNAKNMQIICMHS